MGRLSGLLKKHRLPVERRRRDTESRSRRLRGGISRLGRRPAGLDGGGRKGTAHKSGNPKVWTLVLLTVLGLAGVGILVGALSRAEPRSVSRRVAVVASPASIPTVIKKKDELPGYDIKGVDDSRYSVVITENDKPDPFALSPEMVQITNEVVAPYRRNELRKRAKAIFDWMQKNVPYDEAMKRRIESKEKGEYRGADYTLQDRAGVCGEQAVLYIAMARLAGLQAKYVSVKEDYTGKEVSHGCAGINADVGEFILVDPAYHQFDIKHKKFEAWDDEKVRAVFRVWNKN